MSDTFPPFGITLNTPDDFAVDCRDLNMKPRMLVITKPIKSTPVIIPMAAISLLAWKYCNHSNVTIRIASTNPAMT